MNAEAPMLGKPQVYGKYSLTSFTKGIRQGSDGLML